MAPVIWGLDLAEIKWSKFKSSYMWNTEYHLRRTKFIVYQCALIFCVVSESLGTAALSDYIDAQRFVKQLDRRVYVYNNDYVGAASYNIFAGVFIAFIFGAAFFFDLFWPERHESRGVRIAWKVCGVLSCIFYLASALALTIITATRCQHFRGPGVTKQYGESLLRQFKKDGGEPVCYRNNGRALAAVVFCWPGFVSVVGSCILLFLSIDNIEKGPGPKSAHARRRDDEAGARINNPITSESDLEKEKDGQNDVPVEQPAHVYSSPGADRTVDAAPVAANPVDTAAAAPISPQSHFSYDGKI